MPPSAARAFPKQPMIPNALFTRLDFRSERVPTDLSVISYLIPRHAQEEQAASMRFILPPEAKQPSQDSWPYRYHPVSYLPLESNPEELCTERLPLALLHFFTEVNSAGSQPIAP